MKLVYAFVAGFISHHVAGVPGMIIVGAIMIFLVRFCRRLLLATQFNLERLREDI